MQRSAICLGNQNCPDFQQLRWSRIRGDSLEKGVCSPTTSLGSPLLLPVPHWATLTLPVAHSEGGGLESGDLRGWMAQSDHIM